MLAFTIGVALSVTVTVGLAASLLALWIIYRGDPAMWTDIGQPLAFIGRAAGLSFAVSLGLALIWSLVRLTRSEFTLVQRLEARMPKAGTLLATRSALHDMAIAAGLTETPALYVIDTSRVNAFVVGRSPKRIRIGVTRGLLERIDGR